MCIRLIIPRLCTAFKQACLIHHTTKTLFKFFYCCTCPSGNHFTRLALFAKNTFKSRSVISVSPILSFSSYISCLNSKNKRLSINIEIRFKTFAVSISQDKNTFNKSIENRETRRYVPFNTSVSPILGLLPGIYSHPMQSLLISELAKTIRNI